RRDRTARALAFVRQLRRARHRHRHRGVMAHDGDGPPRSDRRARAHPARVLRNGGALRRESVPKNGPRGPSTPAAEPSVGAHHADDLRVPNVRCGVRARRSASPGPRRRGLHVLRHQPGRASRRGVRGGHPGAQHRRDRRVPPPARPTRRGGAAMNARVLDRTLLYGTAVVLAVWALIPFYLIAVSAITPPADVSDYPKPLFPSSVSAATMQLFLESSGIAPAALNSVIVAFLTVVVCLVLGAPAAYALARFRFRGRETFRA